MYAEPGYSNRRANVISSLAAALVGVAMIAIAGKASADQPATSHMQHARPAHAHDAAQAQSQPNAIETATDAAHHDSHAHVEHATTASSETVKLTTEPDAHPRPTGN